MSYFLLAIYLLVFCLIIIKLPFFKSERIATHWVVLIFLSKFLAGLVLWVIYAFGDTPRIAADIFKYFDDGNVIFTALRQQPIDYLRMMSGIGADVPEFDKYYNTCNFWFKNFNYGLINDNRLIIRFNAFIRLFSMGNIHIHTLFMSFLSFIGFWNIYKVFENKIRVQTIFIVIALFYFPSVYFWTSGLLKESIFMFAFGIMFYQYNKIIIGTLSAKRIVLFILSSILLLFSKFYIFLAAFPGLLFLLIIQISKKKHITISFLISHILLFLLFWFSLDLIGLDLPKIVANKQNDFVNYVHTLPKVGSLIDLAPLESNFLSLAKNTPNALFNSFFRPTLLEVKNPLMLISAIENTFIAFLFIFCFIFYKKAKKDIFFWFSISFVLILFSLIGLTTPVLGALVRYKAPALPFLGIAFLYLIDIDKLKITLKKIIKWQK